MQRKMKPTNGGYQDPVSEPQSSSKRKSVDGILPDNLPDKFFNEDGEVDLRRVTGKEAWAFFKAQGIQLPISGVSRMKYRKEP